MKIDNHLAYNVRDIELTCPEDCPRLQELEEKYAELLAEYEDEVERFRLAYPGESLPPELGKEPEFPECEECNYEQLKKEEKEWWKTHMMGVD